MARTLYRLRQSVLFCALQSEQSFIQRLYFQSFCICAFPSALSQHVLLSFQGVPLRDAAQVFINMQFQDQMCNALVRLCNGREQDERSAILNLHGDSRNLLYAAADRPGGDNESGM